MFEAAITTTLSRALKPSISTSSWFSVWSRSPETSEPRAAPTASSSSMKMIAGAFSRASRNRRRIRAAPRPANISTNDDADWLKKLAPDSWATAFASSVLPVPGGPWRRIPFGTVAPSCLNRFGSERKSTISRSSSFVSSTPATSSQVTAVFDFAEISCGFVCGISLNVRITNHAIRPMKTSISTCSACRGPS